MALGLTQQLPIDEKHIHSKEQAENTISVLMGGRCAEELIFKQKTTGAGDDIDKATDLARKMVCEWGMSERMGPLAFGKREEMIFLGREIAQHQDYSEQTAVEIDREVRRMVTENYERAKDLIKGRLQTLHDLAAALLEKEVLDAPEVDAIVAGADSPEPVGAPA